MPARLRGKRYIAELLYPSGDDDGLSVVELAPDDVLKFRAKSFADLYRQEPRFVEMRFFALLDHLGIARAIEVFSALR